MYANKGAQFLMASDAKVKHKLERRMSRNRTSPRTTAEDEAKCVVVGLERLVASSKIMIEPHRCIHFKCTANSQAQCFAVGFWPGELSTKRSSVPQGDSWG